MSIIGAIIGDIAGSQFEFDTPFDFNCETAELFTDNCHFTDDTVMTLAVKYAIVNDRPFSDSLREFGRKYPGVGYGGRFFWWLLEDDAEPYNSFGNGSAMRVSYVADHFDNLKDVKIWAGKTAGCTHNHPEGIKGAITTAVCIWLAKHKKSKDAIRKYVNSQYPKDQYQYSSEYSIDEIRGRYKWDETCQGSVPVAVRCVLEADSYVEFIRNAYSLPCDMDTICAIGGSIAEELFGGTGLNNQEILSRYLDDDLLKLVFLKP